MSETKKWWSRITRDTLLFGLGAVGFLRELFIGKTERVYILAACLGMMGAPIWIHKDEKALPPPPPEPPTSKRVVRKRA